jgi:protein-arginine kinase activator protein McsA
MQKTKPTKKPTKKIKCEHCGYTWQTKSKHYYVTCPECLRKTPVTDFMPISQRTMTELDKIKEQKKKKQKR